MDFCFSDDFLKVLEFSRNEALRTGWHNIGVDHIMLAVLRHHENDACTSLEALGLDLTDFKCHIDEAVFVDEAISWNERESVNLCDSAQSMLRHAAVEALRCKASCIEAIHFLLAVCRISGSYSHDYLDDCGVSLKALAEASGIEWSRYGLIHSGVSDNRSVNPDDGPAILSDSETSATLLADAIEQRLREGYTTDNPLAS